MKYILFFVTFFSYSCITPQKEVIYKTITIKEPQIIYVDMPKCFNIQYYDKELTQDIFNNDFNILDFNIFNYNIKEDNKKLIIEIPSETMISILSKYEKMYAIVNNFLLFNKEYCDFYIEYQKNKK